MKKNTYLLIVYYIIFSHNILYSHNLNEDPFCGLYFKAFPANKDERTSLHLTPEEPIIFSKDFSMEFDIKFNWKESHFGYVFRFILNDTRSLDMLVNRAMQTVNFHMNGLRSTLFSTSINFTPETLSSKWEHIKIASEGDSLIFHVGAEMRKEYCSFNLFHQKNVDIFFGISKHQRFYATDIPQMTIKNLQISHGNRLIRSWTMSKHANNVILDNINNQQATVTNGIWYINKHTEWKKEHQIPIKQQFTQIAYDSVCNRIFIADMGSLYTYHPSTRKLDNIQIKQGNPYMGAGSMLIYDDLNEKLKSYRTYSPGFSIYDADKQQWTETYKWRIMNSEHHNRIIDKKNNRLIVFGGYGMWKYNSILGIQDLNGGEWICKDLSSVIPPRYLASMGYYKDNKVLLFGGYGSISGSQEKSAGNFYDLFLIDLESFEVDKLGEFTDITNHYTFSNSLIVDNDIFYTLAYPNDKYKSYIKLYEINIKFKYLKDSCTKKCTKSIR